MHISANPKYGSEKKGAPTSYFLVVAPERVRVNCDLHHIDTVLCCDPKIFLHTNPLDGADPTAVSQPDPREEDPRVHPQRVPDRRRGDGPHRPAASHAGQRLPGRVLQGVQLPQELPHRPGSLPRRGPRSIPEEVRPPRRGRRRVEHGGDDQGL
ncbi:MAG: 2-oxoacid:acceptor oxidoreductase family protein [Planctomycetota bacterium]